MVPCYYIFCFGCLMGFIIHFYIIFGTNLLTQGPVQIVGFLPILVFRKKGISNGMKPSGEVFWIKHNPGDLEWTSRNNRGAHEAGGAPTPWVRPSPSWAPRCSTDLLLPPIYIDIRNSNTSSILTRQSCLLKITWL